MVEILELGKQSLLMTVPSVLEDVAFLEYGVGIKTSRALWFVAFGDVPLRLYIGENLAAFKVVLLNHRGAQTGGSPVQVGCSMRGTRLAVPQSHKI
ncbi:hypothetical protein GJ744_004509 [Endocarpon pusillum]|uniref:Uncharacterized protein n=1 Tax=Endocarpon pusillum TaxID=364733 RepID=A0A8H7ATP6_9EURO|nr:hypothetical protein GJ744_004509 [Endocarpon pusillum]